MSQSKQFGPALLKQSEYANITNKSEQRKLINAEGSAHEKPSEWV